MAIQIHDAPARGQLPYPDSGRKAFLVDAERIVDLRSGKRSRADIVAERLSGDVPARLDITSVEAQIGRRHARQFRLRITDLIVPTLNQKIAPVYRDQIGRA